MTAQTNFADLPAEFSNLDSARIIILPVPYDKTSTWQKGADKGPAAIIEASANMELYDIETQSEVYKKGIFTDTPIDTDCSQENLISAVCQRINTNIKNNKFTVTIGGEHSVSIGSIKAHAENYPDLTILQLDAHADLREQYEGSKYNHACVMARAKEIAPVVQIGIRSTDPDHTDILGNDRMFLARDIHDNTDWHKKVLDKLTENVYLTFDLDFFDPSIMPSTGTPEPGGLLWYQTLDFLKKVFQQKNVVGFDVVELCPNQYNKAPDFTAAKLIYKLLSYKFEG